MTQQQSLSRCLHSVPSHCWMCAATETMSGAHSANSRCTALRFMSAGRLPTNTVLCSRSASSSGVSLCSPGLLLLVA